MTLKGLEPGERQNPFRAVSKRDTDGDKRVSRKEWEKSDAVFAKIDQNSDGFLTAEEFFEHWERLKRRRRR